MKNINKKMIEQTELVVTEWIYNTPTNLLDDSIKTVFYLDFDVMKKRVATKKGIACRFTSTFVRGQEMILSYVGEDSYVIDLQDVIDRDELLSMIRNSYSKFTEAFEFRKHSTVLQNNTIIPLDESLIDLDSILPLLI